MTQLILLSGLSGAGKSVALKALEDLGYTCIDNVPACFLVEWCQFMRGVGERRIAASVDGRGRGMLEAVPEQFLRLQQLGFSGRFLFVEASDEALVKRFSETRRNHPLAHGQKTVLECIAQERVMLAELTTIGHRIDTSRLSPNMLRAWVRQFAEVDHSALTLVFQSFGFKHGLSLDADLVFDVRCLPNPHYEPQLRPLSGRDSAVIDFLRNQPEVMAMLQHIQSFVERWLPAYERENRHFLTVSIGCTGGQHRSVYLAEQLAAVFWASRAGQVLVRHRELTV